MLSNRPQTKKGFTIIEVVLAAALLSSFFMSIALYYVRALHVTEQTTHYIQSSFILEEGIEALKGQRDLGWSANIASLANGTTYYLYWSGTNWTTTTTPYKIENYYDRSFVLSAVNRDASDNISSSGTLDTGIRKITMTVSWYGKSGTTTRSVEAYIANLFE